MIEIIHKALEVLSLGGSILYPTDTVWGLGCDATNAEAINNIYKIKNREDTKSLIILLPEANDIFKYIANPHPDIINIIKGFERPTTIIYNQALGLPDNLINQDGSIAIRIIKEPFCKSLLKQFKRPIVSTSANISGKPTPKIFKDIDSIIKQEVDYIVPLRQDEESHPTPSQIIKLHEDGSYDIIRK